MDGLDRIALPEDYCQEKHEADGRRSPSVLINGQLDRVHSPSSGFWSGRDDGRRSPSILRNGKLDQVQSPEFRFSAPRDDGRRSPSILKKPRPDDSDDSCFNGDLKLSEKPESDIGIGQGEDRKGSPSIHSDRFRDRQGAEGSPSLFRPKNRYPHLLELPSPGLRGRLGGEAPGSPYDTPEPAGDVHAFKPPVNRILGRNGESGRRSPTSVSQFGSVGSIVRVEKFGEENENISDMDNISHYSDTVNLQSQLDIARFRQQVGRRRGSLTPSISATTNLSDNGSLAHSKPRKRVSSKFDSMDYTTVESQRFIQEQEKMAPEKVQRVAILRWTINFLVGLSVAAIALLVSVLITHLSKLKFAILYHFLEHCEDLQCLLLPTFIWAVINMSLVAVGAYFVTYHAPHAAGSGIPQIKCYLNGIKLPGLLSLKTLVAKAGGVVLSVVGGLACGKEGPMIHSGAICASCLASSDYYCGKKRWKPKVLEPLRVDEERRDFVAAGAASGVSAAFASPIGGVMFSLEEGASFLNQMLTWRMLFSSITASFVLNVIMGTFKGYGANMSNNGLVSFGYIYKIQFKSYEIPIFMVMAIFGGLSGALFIHINYKLTLFRRQTVKQKWFKVLEAVMIAGVSAVVFMVLIYSIPNCAPIRDQDKTIMSHDGINSHDNTSHTIGHRRERSTDIQDSYSNNTDLHSNGNHENQSDHHGHSMYGAHGSHGYVFRGFCPEGQHNRMANLLFSTGEGGLHSMIHQPLDEFELMPLFVLFVIYFLLATWTYGISVSSGVFIPSLFIGAIWGRIVGIVVMKHIPSVGTNIAKYVIVGAACQLGGTVRMTISLAVILLECTGDITFGIPMIISLILAKWMGDFFTPGIYDLHIEIMGIPLLPWEPPAMCYLLQARDVASTPVVCLRTQEHIGRIAKILDDPECHNGFPVVDDYEPEKDFSEGRLRGFMLKSQLEELLVGPDGTIEEEEKSGTIDLRMHMDKSPFTIQEEVSLPRIFKVFRGLGLRHLVVVNDSNRVTGIITRINLAKFRAETIRGHFKVEELEVQNE